jgi:TorA maturation chaperone TorD
VIDPALAPAARLLGRLLVRELDAATLDELAAPPVAAALAELGIAAPCSARRDELDELAHRWFTLFLQPAGAPPLVQSLWQEDRYEGEAAAGVRAIAAAAARELAPGARGAPPDHLGAILLLWGELADERPELAARLSRDHLAWAETALRGPGRDLGFYGAVARAALALLPELRAGC